MAMNSPGKLLLSTLLLALLFGEALAAAALLDLASFAATGAESRPHDGPKGAALIVYDPGLTGAGKRAAAWMADNLEARHYDVTIAGVRSAEAANASGRAVVIFIAPTLAGKPPGVMAECLGNATVDSGTRVGVFAIKGFLGDDAGPAMRDTLRSRGIPVAGTASVGPLDRDIEKQAYAFLFQLQ